MMILKSLAHAYELRKKFPHRKILLLLHTGGVSERFSELDFLGNPEFKIRQVKDFEKPSFNQSTQMLRVQRIQNKLNLIAKKFFIRLDLFALLIQLRSFMGYDPG